MSVESDIEKAARCLCDATALLITAGAGMGVDSGLPDFRGPEGFWKAYPPYRALGLAFQDLANPEWFQKDPTFAWGFYGHRLDLYRKTRPHGGFAVLKRWAESMPQGHWVYTSNVDGQFQRAGFDPNRIVECHGAIDFLQCTGQCGIGIFPADDFHLDVDAETFRAREPLPRCPKCGAMARPNILMFGGWDWEDKRTYTQHDRFEEYISTISSSAERMKLLIVECGAGTGIPTIRALGERLVREDSSASLVRINVRESQVPVGHVGLPMGALEALLAMDSLRSKFAR
jgi:NAD-dependent SIR2 family protein deacetylase